MSTNILGTHFRRALGLKMLTSDCEENGLIPRPPLSRCPRRILKIRRRRGDNSAYKTCRRTRVPELIPNNNKRVPNTFWRGLRS